MSKSLGNGVDPIDIAKRMGGEIVRLWVASVNFREDTAASENLMQRCAELYKKLRNTFRFLLGNLHGFVPARDRVPEAELLPLDRYMLARTRDLTEKIVGWYRQAFEFHRVYHAVNEFAIVDLSSFYLDVLKDRMYTFAPTSTRAAPRRPSFGRSPRPWSGWSRPSSPLPPTRSGSICLPSKAAKPACTLRCFRSLKKYSPAMQWH